MQSIDLCHLLKNKMKGNEWILKTSNCSEIVFKRESSDYDFVEISDYGKRGYKVTLPMKTSRFSYVTHITDPTEVSDYVGKFLKG